jgi:hypothetical protein
MDGVRIFSKDKCEFLQRVPPVVEEIFKIGSTSPPAMLYDAIDLFEKQSPRAEENIRSIKTDLKVAVDKCIEAAGYEPVISLQTNLLKAASFGKSYMEDYDSRSFVEMCKLLRLLNAVNFFEIGIPLTITQYNSITITGLINRLINRNEHLIAMRICEFMKIKKDRVLVNWACKKVQSNETTADVSSLIVKKLENIPGISYAAIASTAYKAGRVDLATKVFKLFHDIISSF